MLGRFPGGILHHVVHVGYSFRLGLPGIVAEGDFYLIAIKRELTPPSGLAQATVHSDDSSARIPESSFEERHSSRALGYMMSRSKSFVISEAPGNAPPFSGVDNPPNSTPLSQPLFAWTSGKIDHPLLGRDSPCSYLRVLVQVNDHRSGFPSVYVETLFVSSQDDFPGTFHRVPVPAL